MAEQVVIEFSADPSGLIPVVEQLKNIGSISEEEFDKFKKAATDARKSLDELYSSQKKMLEGNKEAGKSLDDLAKSAKNLGDSIRTATANTSLNQLAEQLNTASAAMQGAGKSTKEYWNDVLKAKNNLDSLKKTQNDTSQSTDDYTNKVKAAKLELKNAKIALNDHEKALRESYAAGVDTSTSLNMVKKALSDSVSAYVLSASLISGNSEEQIKNQKAVQDTMKVIQALEAVHQTIDAVESANAARKMLWAKAEIASDKAIAGGKKALMEVKRSGQLVDQASATFKSKLIATSKAEMAASKGVTVAQLTETEAKEAEVAADNASILTRLKATAALGAETAAKGAGAIASGIATATQWAWNVALNAFPVFLVITGIAALIAIIIKAVQWIKEKTVAFNILGKVVGAVTDAIRNFLSLFTSGWIDNADIHKTKQEFEDIQKTSEKTSESLKSQIALLEATGAKTEEIAKAKEAQLKAELDGLDAKAHLADNEEDKAKALNELLQKRAEGYKEELDAINERGEELKKQGKSEADILKDRQEQYNEQEKKINAEIAASQKLIDQGKDLNGIEAERIKVAKTALNGIKNLENKANEDILREKEETEKELAHKALESAVKTIQARLALVREGSAEELKLKKELIDAEEKLDLDGLKKGTAEYDLQVAEAQKKRQDLAKDAHEKYIELQKKKLENQKAGIELELLNARKGSEEELKDRKELLEKQFQLDTEEMNKSSNAYKLAEATKNEAIKKLAEDFAKNAAAKELSDEKALLDLKLQATEKDTKEQLDLQIKLIENEKKAKLAAISEEEKNTAAGQEKINAIRKKAEIDQKKLHDDYLKHTIEVNSAEEKDNTRSEKEKLETKLKAQGIAKEERKKLQEDLEKLEKGSDAKQLGFLEELHKNQLISEKDYKAKLADIEKQKTQVAKEESDKRLANEKKNIEEAKKATEAALNAINQMSQLSLQNKLNEYAKDDDANKKLLANKQISEKEYQRRQTELKKKEAEEKKKAAELEKKLKIFGILVNAPEAIIKAFSEGGPYIGPIMAGIIAATTAIQIAQVSSQQVPGYAKGTKKAPAGFKWVGEEGPELLHDKGGYAIINHPDSMALLQKYEIPALQDSIVTRMASTPSLSPAAIEQMMKFSASSTSTTIDYSRLAKAISENFGAQLKNMPHTHLNISEQGFKVFIQGVNSKTDFLNSRYRS